MGRRSSPEQDYRIRLPLVVTLVKEQELPRMNEQALSSFIWSVADLLRGDYNAIRIRQGHSPLHRAEIDAELKECTDRILAMIKGLSA